LVTDAQQPQSGGEQPLDAGALHLFFAQSAQYPLLPRTLEVELALSAAPKHVRDNAAVWILDKTTSTARFHERHRIHI
jgi:hypothetical protein